MEKDATFPRVTAGAAALLLLLFCVSSVSCEEGLEGEEFRTCEAQVEEWVRDALSELLHVETEETASYQDDTEMTQQDHLNFSSSAQEFASYWNKRQRRALLFFLHIPRTGGRTYHQCFLKALFPPHLRCPRSYDTLRLDPQRPHCQLLSTHDDYSLMTKLPVANTSVITNVRRPFDRILSAYEFVVEITARMLRLDPRKMPYKSVEEVLKHIHSRRRGSDERRTETRDVWPWSVLLPVMEADFWMRKLQKANLGMNLPESMEADRLRQPERSQKGKEEQKEESDAMAEGSAYNSPNLVMPLLQFIQDPAVLDTLVNGGTFQVLGLTNNSHIPSAHRLRSCAQKYRGLGSRMLKVAKERLNVMLHVGLTEEHELSVHMMMAAMRQSPDAPAFTARDTILIPGRHGSRPGGRGQDRWEWKRRVRGRELKQMNGGHVGILHHYRRCVAAQRNHYKIRKLRAMTRLGIKFSSEARESIPSSVKDMIREMNWMDEELFAHAQTIFEKERKVYLTAAGRLGITAEGGREDGTEGGRGGGHMKPQRRREQGEEEQQQQLMQQQEQPGRQDRRLLKALVMHRNGMQPKAEQRRKRRRRHHQRMGKQETTPADCGNSSGCTGDTPQNEEEDYGWEGSSSSKCRWCAVDKVQWQNLSEQCS